MNIILPFAGFLVGSFAIVYVAIPIIFRKEIAHDEKIRFMRHTSSIVEISLPRSWTKTMATSETTILIKPIESERQNTVFADILGDLHAPLNIAAAYPTLVQVNLP